MGAMCAPRAALWRV